jgi:hypothetical protein
MKDSTITQPAGHIFSSVEAFKKELGDQVGSVWMSPVELTITSPATMTEQGHTLHYDDDWTFWGVLTNQGLMIMVPQDGLHISSP